MRLPIGSEVHENPIEQFEWSLAWKRALKKFHAICKVHASCKLSLRTMATSQDLIDLNSAAQLAGVHRTTIFRAIRKGELHARKLQQDGNKAQYYLDSAAFKAWLDERSQVAQVASCDNIAKSQAPLHFEQFAPQTMHDFNQNLAEALRQADQARHQSQQAWEESRRLERQVMALQYELNKYQHALGESAESLQEARAREKELQAKLESHQVPPPEITELKEARTQVNFSQRRFGKISRWGQRLFGT